MGIQHRSVWQDLNIYMSEGSPYYMVSAVVKYPGYESALDVTSM